MANYNLVCGGILVFVALGLSGCNVKCGQPCGEYDEANGKVDNTTEIVCLDGSEDTGGMTKCKSMNFTAGALPCNVGEDMCLQASVWDAATDSQDESEIAKVEAFIARIFPSSLPFSMALFAFGLILMAGVGVVVLRRRQQDSAEGMSIESSDEEDAGNLE
jgi:hypothetical protein